LFTIVTERRSLPDLVVSNVPKLPLLGAVNTKFVKLTYRKLSVFPEEAQRIGVFSNFCVQICVSWFIYRCKKLRWNK
jgi:hypothetical protein